MWAEFNWLRKYPGNVPLQSQHRTFTLWETSFTRKNSTKFANRKKHKANKYLHCKRIWQLSPSTVRDSSGGIATRYGTDGPWMESRQGRDFLHPSRPILRSIQPPIQWVQGLFPVEKWPGRGVNHPPPSSAEVKERVELYTSTPPLWAFMACSMLNFTVFLTFTSTKSFGRLSKPQSPTHQSPPRPAKIQSAELTN